MFCVQSLFGAFCGRTTAPANAVEEETRGRDLHHIVDDFVEMLESAEESSWLEMMRLKREEKRILKEMKSLQKEGQPTAAEIQKENAARTRMYISYNKKYSTRLKKESGKLTELNTSLFMQSDDEEAGGLREEIIGTMVRIRGILTMEVNEEFNECSDSDPCSDSNGSDDSDDE